MGIFSDNQPTPIKNHRIAAFHGMSVDRLPPELFVSSEILQFEGWPDFGIRTLADWQSSLSPASEGPVDDCCLVAGLTLVPTYLSNQDDWRLVVHETGGIWQEPKRALVRRLTVTEHGRSIAHMIARHMASTNVSARFASFDQLIGYRNLLNGMGLDCNENVQCLAEAFYPIDLTEEAISIFGVVDLAVEFSEGVDDGKMFLAIMAPNCSEF